MINGNKYIKALLHPTGGLREAIKLIKLASVNHPIIVSDNGLSPVRRQAIIWTNAGF